MYKQRNTSVFRKYHADYSLEQLHEVQLKLETYTFLEGLCLQFTVYEQRNTSVTRKHHADYRGRGNWGTTKARNISFKFWEWCQTIRIFKTIRSGKINLTEHFFQSLRNVPCQ